MMLLAIVVATCLILSMLSEILEAIRDLTHTMRNR
jgi:hypothetical protein